MEKQKPQVFTDRASGITFFWKCCIMRCSHSQPRFTPYCSVCVCPEPHPFSVVSSNTRTACPGIVLTGMCSSSKPGNQNMLIPRKDRSCRYQDLVGHCCHMPQGCWFSYFYPLSNIEPISSLFVKQRAIQRKLKQVLTKQGDDQTLGEQQPGVEEQFSQWH